MSSQGLIVSLASFTTEAPWPISNVSLDVYRVESHGGFHYYVPLKQLVPLLGVTQDTLNKYVRCELPDDHLAALVSFIRKHATGRGNPVSVFVSLPRLREYTIEKDILSEYNAGLVVNDMKELHFQQGDAPAKENATKKKRLREGINLVDDDDEQDDRLPNYIQRFFREADRRIGLQAVAAFQSTDDFKQRINRIFDEVEKEVRNRLESELREGVEKDLREKLAAEVRADFEANEKPKLLQELQLKTAQQGALQSSATPEKSSIIVTSLFASRSKGK